MKSKTGVLLVNLGTPDSPSVRDVRSYLSQFLNDPRVIDIPWLARKILVNLIIVPFRAPKSAAIYKKLWTENGSPLLYFSNKVTTLLQQELGSRAMMYIWRCATRTHPYHLYWRLCVRKIIRESSYFPCFRSMPPHQRDPHSMK